MSVSVCIEASILPGETIVAVLDALVTLNERLISQNRVRMPPWNLRWVPDELVVCDASACAYADTSKLQDIVVLMDRGQGSCGPLACAYAAWLTVVDGRPATVRLISTGRDKWHVVALADGADGTPEVAFDPQVIGARK